MLTLSKELRLQAGSKKSIQKSLSKFQSFEPCKTNHIQERERLCYPINKSKTIQNLSTPRDFEDNVKAFLTFGHLFEGNIAVTLAHTYCIQGKPALNADAMAGAVRRYVGKDGKKVCAMIWEEIREESVTVFALRRDELELSKEYNIEIKPKSWTYTLEDARLRGTLNQRAWKTMPKVMMHKRALTALLRLAFPEILGTACSPG